MSTELERIARIEQMLVGIGDDMKERVEEERRARRRLHNLEGLAQGLVDEQKQRRVEVRLQSRRLETRIQLLTLAMLLASVVSPIVAAYIVH